MAKRPGSLWVEGAALHHVDASGNEWSFTGDSIGSPAGATPGSVWLDTSTNRVHYIAAGGAERVIQSSQTANHIDAAAIQGSIWVEGSFVNFISNTSGQEIVAHMDLAHNDHTDHNDAHTDHTDHSDAAHTDHSDHADTHDDAHLDNHTDHGDIENPHEDLHGDSHDDTLHTDHTDHDDIGHTDHSDHSDVAHSDHSDHIDQGHDDRPVFIGP